MWGTLQSRFDVPFRRATPPAVAGAAAGGALLFGAIALQYTTVVLGAGLLLAVVGGHVATTYLDATATVPSTRQDHCGCPGHRQVELSDGEVYAGGFGAGVALVAVLAVAVVLVG